MGSFSKEGFAPCCVPLGATAQSASVLDVKMQKLTASGKVDPAEGGQLVDAVSGASITMAPGTKLVSKDGCPYHGEVDVSFTVIDPMDPKSLEAMPGDFS